MVFQITIRQIKYLNNALEQDHRAVKRITKPMMGFKSFHSAEAAIAGIELHHMLKKGQHKAGSHKLFFSNFMGWRPSCAHEKSVQKNFSPLKSLRHNPQDGTFPFLRANFILQTLDFNLV